MKNHLRTLALSLSVGALSGCLYTNIHKPWTYRASTPVEVKSVPNDLLVHGKSCDRMVLYLFAWGDSGYRAATQNALGLNEGILYDVKTDVHVNAYLLGLYTRTCTEVTGKVGHL